MRFACAFVNGAEATIAKLIGGTEATRGLLQLLVLEDLGDVSFAAELWILLGS